MEQFANTASSTLNGTITSGALSLMVQSATTFPTQGNFRILVDSEIMLVTAVSSNTFTVTRAQEGTAAAAHTSGVAVTHILTKGALAQLKLDVVGVLYSGSGSPNPNGFVQGSSSSGLSTTTSTSVTSGDLLILLLQTESAISSVGSITVGDNLGSVYTAVANSIGNPGVNAILYAAFAGSTGICTVTGNQGSSFARMTLAEFNHASQTVDVQNQGYAVTTLSVTTTQNADLVIGAVGGFHSSAVFTPGTGFATAVQGNGSDASFIMYATQAAPATVTATYMSSAATDNAPFFEVAFLTQNGFVAVGEDGDFYLDVVNRKIYGPRGSGVYPYVGSFNP